MRQLLVERNKAKEKKATNIEEIRVELRGIMGDSHRHLFNDDEEGEEDVYMYSTDMNPEKRADY